MAQYCARAEILAGAIALGEATESERDEYRRHVATCSPCLTAIGGEREIERTMDLVSSARESEVWEPVLPDATARRKRAAGAWRWGLSATAVAVVASLAIHAFVAAQMRPVTIAQRTEVVSSQPFVHVTIERRAPAQPPPAVPKTRVVHPSIVVVHNVITLRHPQPVDTPATNQRPQTTIVAESVSLKTQSDVPVWRRDEAMPKPTTAQPSSPTPIMQGRAESIAVAPTYVIRDVEPIGGDTAINPRPPMLAYDIGAEGTTAFEVSVDERGAPVKCTITKSSGYAVLDAAVCRAAMKARYSPRTINGRAVAGVYRDAFTFRSENNPDNQF
jgi:periplasmic protein TonB